VDTHEHGERRVGVIPQKEPYFPPPIRGFGHGEVEVRIDSMPRFDIDVHATQNYRFDACVRQEPGAKEVHPQIKVGLNPHVGFTQGHKGCDMQDPRGGQVVQFQTIILMNTRDVGSSGTR
jgi:hypothetical protein